MKPSETTKYWADKEEWDRTHPVKMVKVLPASSPSFNIPILRQNIDNIDSMTDEELRNFVYRNYKSILANISRASGYNAHRKAGCTSHS